MITAEYRYNRNGFDKKPSLDGHKNLITKRIMQHLVNLLIHKSEHPCHMFKSFLSTCVNSGTFCQLIQFWSSLFEISHRDFEI